MWIYLISVSFCFLLWKLLAWIVTSWKSYDAITRALSKLPVPDDHHWFYGVAHKVKDSETYINLCQKAVEKHRVKALAFWLTWLRPAVAVVHPGPMKDILKASHASAPKSREYGLFIPWIGEGLLVSNGRKWERSRRLLTPAFHFDVLKPYVRIYNDVADLLLSKLSSLGTGGKSVDVCPLVSRATLDTMLRCALSYVNDEVQSTERNQHPFCEAMITLKHIIIRRWADPVSHSDLIFNLKSDSKELKKACDFVHQFSGNLIRSRRKALEEDPSQLEKRHLDFLDILLTARDDSGVGLTDQEIRDEVDTFMFEGHDTTASAIMWAFYSLAKYPEMQQRVREEVEGILAGRKTLEYDDLAELHFTTCFIKESMRIFTPVPSHNRRLSEPVTIDGVVFPAETVVDILPWCLHHHPDVWENPYEFDPDRFLPDNFSKKDPFAFLPFSAGQRNCIGQHFAMNEIKILVSRLATRFVISLDTNKKAVPLKEVVTSAKDGIYLHIKEL